MKFKPGDRVTRVSDLLKGEVLKANWRQTKPYGYFEEEKTYLVVFENGEEEWKDEVALRERYYTPRDPAELKDEELCNMIIIDACLKYEKFEALKEFAEEEEEA